MSNEIEFKGKKYQLKELKYGQWRKILKLRKEAVEKNDEYLMAEALGIWLKTAVQIEDEELNNWTITDIIEFSQKLANNQTIPLQQRENLDDPLSPEIPL